MVDTSSAFQVQWTPDAAALLRVKRLFQNKTWEKIKDDHFPHRSEQAVRGQWRRMLKANPKLLDNGAYSVTASNMEKDPGVDEATQGAELLDRTDNTAASNMKDFRATHKGRKAIYPEIEDRAQDERQMSGRQCSMIPSSASSGPEGAASLSRGSPVAATSA